MDACGNETLSAMRQPFYNNLPYHSKKSLHNILNKWIKWFEISIA